jgi:endonuclease/exonuclease/phosphatase (EEP) superfamily protein YafD
MRVKRGSGMPSVRRVLAEALAVFLTLNAAAGAGAAVLAHGGRWSAALDILTHFAVLYLAGGALVIVLALLLRNWGRLVAAGLGAVAVLASLLLMAPELLRGTGPAAPSDAPGQVKVIQFNTLRTNADIGPIADWLIAQRPDIVTLTEARHDLRDLLIERTGWHTAGAHGHLIIFSREPRLQMRRPALPQPTPLTFVNAAYPSASGPYELVTVHFDWPTGREQPREHAALPALLAQRPRDRMILTGDFNSSPWSFALRRTEERLGLIRRDKALATFPATRRGFLWPTPVLSIDHVYAGPGWATVKVERGPRLGSDHYPLVVTLAPVAPR